MKPFLPKKKKANKRKDLPIGRSFLFFLILHSKLDSAHIGFDQMPFGSGNTFVNGFLHSFEIGKLCVFEDRADQNDVGKTLQVIVACQLCSRNVNAGNILTGTFLSTRVLSMAAKPPGATVSINLS